MPNASCRYVFQEKVPARRTIFCSFSQFQSTFPAEGLPGPIDDEGNDGDDDDDGDEDEGGDDDEIRARGGVVGSKLLG